MYTLKKKLDFFRKTIFEMRVTSVFHSIWLAILAKVYELGLSTDR